MPIGEDGGLETTFKHGTIAHSYTRADIIETLD